MNQGEGHATWRWAAFAVVVGTTAVLPACGARTSISDYFADGDGATDGAGASDGAGGTFGAGASLGSGGSAAGPGLPILLGHAPDPRLEPPTFCTLDGWCGSNADFVAISGTSATDIWIVANDTGSLSEPLPPYDPTAPISSEPLRTAILHWDGYSWAAEQFGPEVIPGGAGLRAITAIAADDVWAVGDSGVVLHFDGASWVRAFSFDSVSLLALSANGGNDVWFAGTDSVLHQMNDGALNTVPLANMGGVTSLSQSGESLWVVGPDLVGHRNPNMSASSQNPSQLWAIWAASPTVAFAVGNEGALARSENTVDWVFMDSDVSYVDFRAVWGRSASDVWAVGRLGGMAHFDGNTWQGVVAVTSRNLNAVWGTADGTWAVGDDGTFVSFQGDVAIDSRPAGTALSAIWGSAPEDVWAVGSEVVHWNGSAWQRVPFPNVPELLALSGTSSTDAWAVGRGGASIHWDGAAWDYVPVGTTYDINAVWATSVGPTWAVGQDGISYLNPGDGWSMLRPEMDSALKGVAGNAVGDLVVVGEEGRRTVLTGTIEFDVPPPTPGAWYSVAFADGEHIWTGGSAGDRGPKAVTLAPVLGRWDVDVMVDGFEPGPEFGLTGNPILAGCARSIDDVWIALPSVMHWDGAHWAYSSVGGSEQVTALARVGQDLWAITAEGNVVRRRLP